DLAAQALVPPLAVLLRRGGELPRTRAEVGVLGLDHREHSLAHEIRERRTTDLGEAGREHDVAEVAVLEVADLLGQRLLCREPDGILERGRLLPERLPPGQPSGVEEHVAQRDTVFLAAAKVGDQLPQRGVERELPLANERKKERGRRELGERRQIEE